MNICVYGAASDTIADGYIKAGEALGLEMAKRGHRLVYGGGATGMMGAVARGMAEGKGYVTGVVPEFFTNEEILNTACDQFIRTRTMRERKQIMEFNSEGFIVTPGGIGTYEEFFEILTLKQLARHDKPTAVFNINGFYDDMMLMLERAIRENFLKAECREMYPFFSGVEEVLNYIENYEKMDLKHMKV